MKKRNLEIIFIEDDNTERLLTFENYSSGIKMVHFKKQKEIV